MLDESYLKLILRRHAPYTSCFAKSLLVAKGAPFATAFGQDQSRSKVESAEGTLRSRLLRAVGRTSVARSQNLAHLKIGWFKFAAKTRSNNSWTCNFDMNISLQ